MDPTPLFSTDVYEVKLQPWQYHAVLDKEGITIKIRLQLIVPQKDFS